MDKRRQKLCIPILLSAVFAGCATVPGLSPSHSEIGTRTVSFVTEEVTGMSIDFRSVDSSVYFDALGSIFSRRVDGTVQKIDCDQVWAEIPRVSPIGTFLAFRSARDISGPGLWVQPIGGCNAKKVSEHDVVDFAWHNQGRRLVSLVNGDADSYGHREQFIVEHDLEDNSESELVVLHNPIGKVARFVAYADKPDHLLVVFEEFRGNTRSSRIVELDVTSGRRIDRFKASGSGADFRVSYEHGHAVLVVNDDSDFFTAIPEGMSGSTALAFLLTISDDFAPSPIPYIFQGGTRIAFRHDSASLLFTESGRINSFDLQTSSIEKLPFSVKVKVEIRDAPTLDFPIIDDEMPMKHLRRMQISRLRNDIFFEHAGKIWRHELLGGSTNQVCERDAWILDFAISKDEESIVYSTYEEHESGQMFLCNLQSGSSLTVSPEYGIYTSLAWSPDDRVIAYLGAAEPNTECHRRPAQVRAMYPCKLKIWIANTRSGEKRMLGEVNAPLLTGSSHYPQLQFIQDGKRLAYIEDQIGEGEFFEVNRYIVSVPVAGGEKRVHARISRNVDHFAFSPNGKRVALATRWGVSLVDLAQRRDALGVPDLTNLPKEQTILVNSAQLTWRNEQFLDAMFLNEIVTFDSATLTRTEVTRVEYGRSFPRRGEVTALTNATIIPMDGNEVIAEAAIVLKDRRIAAVGPMSQVDIPKEAKIIDLAGKFIIPGLIDSHLHSHQVTTGVHFPYGYQQAHQDAALAYGVTTIFDPSASTLDVGRISELEKIGEVRSPRVFTTGQIVAPHFREQPQHYPIEDLRDAQRIVERLKRSGATAVKNYSIPNIRQRRELAEAAAQYGLLSVGHLGNGSGYQEDLSYILEAHQIAEHFPNSRRFYDDVVQLIGRSRKYLTPTLDVSVPSFGPSMYTSFYSRYYRDCKYREIYADFPQLLFRTSILKNKKAPEFRSEQLFALESLAKIVDKGGKLAAGSHSYPGLPLHWELQLFVAGGMDEEDALRTATSWGASKLGIDASIGTINVGKIADLVVLHASPLEDIRNTEAIHSVWKNGRSVYSDEHVCH